MPVQVRVAQPDDADAIAAAHIEGWRVGYRHVFPTEYLLRAVPAGRLGTGDDIAAACAFLCSDAASYITGQVIAVNGGAVT